MRVEEWDIDRMLLLGGLNVEEEELVTRAGHKTKCT